MGSAELGAKYLHFVHPRVPISRSDIRRNQCIMINSHGRHRAHRLCSLGARQLRLSVLYRNAQTSSGYISVFHPVDRRGKRIPHIFSNRLAYVVIKEVCASKRPWPRPKCSDVALPSAHQVTQKLSPIVTIADWTSRHQKHLRNSQFSSEDALTGR